MLRQKGIGISDELDGPLRPGSVVFVKTPDGVTHRDYVTHAWTENPVKEVLRQNGGNACADKGCGCAWPVNALRAPVRISGSCRQTR